MARKKLNRFAELKDLTNVFDKVRATSDTHWLRDHFRNDAPLVVELGCGKGEYTLELARRFRDKNVLGVDRNAARLWKGAKAALEEKLDNAAFLRVNIEEIGDCLDSGQVDEIWLTFPDPLPKRRQAKHRLVSRPFLHLYRALLRDSGRIHLKTDDRALIEYLLRLLQDDSATIHKCLQDVYASEPDDALTTIKTTFERRHLQEGRKIQYLCFSFGGDVDESLPDLSRTLEGGR